jgi:uridylate kinase
VTDDGAAGAERTSGMAPGYRRILLKMSGELLGDPGGSGISVDRVHRLAEDLQVLHARGVQIGLVVGGGNIFRGAIGTTRGIDRVTGDHMGMLATVINSLAVQDALEKHGVPACVMSALRIEAVAEPYVRRDAIRRLEAGQVVIVSAGTGNPFFTTDTAGVLRAIELGCDVIIKGTKVDGVYDDDPARNPAARRFDRLSYRDVLSRDLKVMDATAISLSRENDLPIIVFDISRRGDLLRIVEGEPVGTRVAKGDGA